MRGEHPAWSNSHTLTPGSSPHARGTLNRCIFDVLTYRIIPACAGNTQNFLDFRIGEWDHPRMRGEHRPAWMPRRKPTGSSPHARGTLRLQRRMDPRNGIIPACAGNTNRRYDRRETRWDHPRMRGEHGSIKLPIPFATGSSPHARGTLGRIR